MKESWERGKKKIREEEEGAMLGRMKIPYSVDEKVKDKEERGKRMKQRRGKGDIIGKKGGRRKQSGENKEKERQKQQRKKRDEQVRRMRPE